MTGEEREELRRLIDEARRDREHLPSCLPGHGYSSKYRDGCRCEACTAAATEARRARRIRALERASTADRSCPRWRRMRDYIVRTAGNVDADEQADRAWCAIQRRRVS